MKLSSTLLFLFTVNLSAFGQDYFPPGPTAFWDTISPSELGWCTDKIEILDSFLITNNTKSFIILHKGKIVKESYYNDHSAADGWYWASAGKSLMAMLVGIAQEEGSLKLSDRTTDYLGRGWTSMTPAQEDQITLWNHLTFTTGVDWDVDEIGCYDPECLQYKSDPGTQWYYHNATYTLWQQILANAVGESVNAYTRSRLLNKIGMDGIWFNNGPYITVFRSTARSMARYGLLVAREGEWDGESIIGDKDFMKKMTQPSQDINESYGYLWWLNGQESIIVPGLPNTFSTSLSPSAPADLVAGMGANGQFIEVIPSLDLVVVRMGEAPGSELVPIEFHDDMWKYIMDVVCLPTSVDQEQRVGIEVFPNPVNHQFSLRGVAENIFYEIINIQGQVVQSGLTQETLEVDRIENGIYILKIEGVDQGIKLIKK